MSVRYLKESLEMLQEIQRTGDIFFPSAWLNATFGSYQSKEAAEIVRSFLKSHPAYNAKLKMKILQAADPLFRAEKLIAKGNTPGHTNEPQSSIKQYKSFEVIKGLIRF